LFVLYSTHKEEENLVSKLES